MDLLSEWAQWRCSSPPYVLNADRPVLLSPRSQKWVDTATWPRVHRGNTFCAPGNKNLQLGLLPQPFFGDLRKASIYVLLLNPGVGPSDYYGESAVPPYRKALLATLRQQFAPGSISFIFLDPQFSWHGGFGWWHGKFARLIARLAKEWEVPFRDARARLGSRLASIELVPYHSSVFQDHGWIRGLHSVALACAFVRDRVIPRVRDGQAIAIVTRHASTWNLPHHSRIIKYSGQQARAAHLTPDSPGGRAILKLLLR
jgi:hypothetical protein